MTVIPILLLACLALPTSSGQEQPDANFPYYLQSPVNAPPEEQLVQRSLYVAAGGKSRPSGKQKPEVASSEQQAECLYEKQFFHNLDQCLARKPYPTVGLLAFKNEDQLTRRRLADRHGCQFILSNGLFKNYQLSKYALDADGQCLDGAKLSLSMSFHNISQSYLWTLRCLNRADQLLEDATLGGQTSRPAPEQQVAGESEPSICVGSSQNFGFTSLQLSAVDAQVELAADIYRNWQLTNLTVLMAAPTGLLGAAPSLLHADPEGGQLPGTNIRDFVFESLDGDELNWRHLPSYQNWARNRMHTNFLDQFRRFLWISIQRCLAESTNQLPVKLANVFSGQRYN